MSKQVLEIRKVDETVVADTTLVQPLYVIFESENGCILADASFLQKWLEENGFSKEAAVTVVDLVAACGAVKCDAEEGVLIGRMSFLKMEFM